MAGVLVDRSTVLKIRDELASLRRKVDEVDRRTRFARSQDHEDMLIAKSTGGIAARSGTTCTGVAVPIYTINTSGSLVVTTTGTPRRETAYNLSGTAVAAGKFITLKRDLHGTWVVDWEDCAST